ncbi:BgTH12-05177 [Blumeria graminis f. sp. triticale]|uniref:BgtE-20021 n=3 Tax=Blumeria graminis TaxID=34373 RepID=A0A381L3N9_BLUGR|nr:BgTH12-05171 [Blumeria graminis f. sp. triticale]CAD6502586.1 BgTH12-05177 [Blumeria graminis f. sp. triticale]VDB87997.1 BgtE-20021 [Blumeria graminis f. sp. tritici]
MRFSSIAIIFQSASIFTTTLAARRTSHLDDLFKVFDCNGYFIRYPQFSSSQRSETFHSGQGRMSRSWSAQLDYLLQRPGDERVVLFGNGASHALKYYSLDTLATGNFVDSWINNMEFIIAIDNLDRACGIIMKFTSRNCSSEISCPPQESFSLCSITY